MTKARVDVTVKLTEIPQHLRHEAGGARSFVVTNASGTRILVTLSKKSWKKLETAPTQWPEWMAIINGQLGEMLEGQVFCLDNAGLVSLVERKGKEPEPTATTPPEGASASDAAAGPAASAPTATPSAAPSSPPQQAIPIPHRPAAKAPPQPNKKANAKPARPAGGPPKPRHGARGVQTYFDPEYMPARYHQSAGT